MTWRLEFYHERRRILAPYRVEARLPAEAVARGWTAVRAEHPTPARRGRPGLFEQAQRLGGQDASGWILYRIVVESERAAPGAARAPAA
jgi:hypothetical protein